MGVSGEYFSTDYFDQPCPTCGRPMRIRAEWDETKVCCAHCSAISVADASKRFRRDIQQEIPSDCSTYVRTN
ncbi:hypothetical protein CA13_12460 [Planctomycetes bacterium CA13]|uniref:Uncharacterized protein n=1 Tax=Novipirellula herctigrandis TaxID=2527986 RepID=A0A5C5YXN9_9BACT|nr:hypothetical protein CA13_12460 [Planctomycetes bacterium CA13]